MPGQYLFGVAPMTAAAVTTTFVFSAIYHSATGSYYFVDSHVPIAVFIGMTLLFTDPATSPRTLLGRIFYGVLYGLSTVLLYDLLLSANTPGFYDKLLQVPLLNLSVILLDRLARSLKSIDPSAWLRNWAPRRRHLAYMGVWGTAFFAMSASGHLGDEHPGQWTPYWEQACAADKRDACLNLYFLHDGYCDGRLRRGRATRSASCWPSATTIAPSPRRRSTARARCSSAAGCDNAGCHREGRHAPRHDAPTARRLRRSSSAAARVRSGDREPARALRARLRVGVAERLRESLIAYTTGLRTSAPYASCPGAT